MLITPVHSRRTPWAMALTALVVLLTVGTARVVAQATVVLRISVVNPLDREQRKDVRSNLPAGLEADDILDTDGLDLRYDVSQDRYYVVSSVNLAPRQRIDYRVTMRDVWVLPDETLTAYAAQAGRLAARLADTEYSDLALSMAGEIEADVAAIRENQVRHAIAAGARAADHIRAYHTNREALAEVGHRIGYLENLVLGAGRDPGELLGRLPDAPRPALTGAQPAATNEVVMVVTVRNTSPDHERTIDLRRDLPREIRPRDVLDPGDLQVGIDSSRDGSVYVFLDGLELAPQETRSFEIRLQDRWNVHALRMDALMEAATRLLQQVAAMSDYPSVEAHLAEIIDQIEALRQEPVPTEVNDRYVAFFRSQGDRLRALEEKIGRVEVALRPGSRGQRLGFDVQPPDPRTTWLLIYGILGFLGLISLLFFLRWFGKGSK